jgi:hypothetical protein
LLLLLVLLLVLLLLLLQAICSWMEPLKSSCAGIVMQQFESLLHVLH